MATIDSNIAMGYKPVQIENPLNQMAAMSQVQNAQNQNALAQYQLSAAQRADESTNIKNQLYAKHYDATTGKINAPALYKDLALYNQGSLIPKVQAEQTEIEHKQNVNQEVIARTAGLNYTQEIKKYDRSISHIGALNTPQEALASINDSLAKGEIDKPKADALIKSLNDAPNFLDWKKKIVLGSMDAKDQMVTQETARANAEKERIERLRTNISQGTLDVSRQRLANETNPVLQGDLAAAKKRAEENVKFEVQGRIDVAANRKALKQAGYDPITGEDDITKLIKESTGGYLGKGLDIGARVFGSATEGSVALAQLEQKGNAITFGLLNGKLGAGISTSDRQFIEALVSRISDGTLPVEDRLAAWTSAKDMMRTLGMVEPPTKSGANKPSAAPAANTGSVPVPSLTDIFNPKPKTK
jgi:hypothetical protein